MQSINNNLLSPELALNNSTSILDAPMEMIVNIVKYLDYKSYNSLKLANKFFYMTLTSDYFKEFYKNRIQYALAIKVLKTFSHKFDLFYCINASIFDRPDTLYGLNPKKNTYTTDVFSNEGILSNEHLNFKLLDKLKILFRFRSQQLIVIKNFTEEENSKLIRIIKLLSERFPQINDVDSNLNFLNIEKFIKTFPEYQNIDLSTCKNVELTLNNNSRSYILNGIYELKDKLNHKNSKFDFNTIESFLSSVDNLMLNSFNLYVKEVFNLFLSSPYESIIVGELFRKLVNEIEIYKNNVHHYPFSQISNTNKSIVEIAADLFDFLESACVDANINHMYELNYIKILAEFKIKSTERIIDNLFKLCFAAKEGHVATHLYPSLTPIKIIDASIRKIISIDPLRLTPDFLKLFFYDLTYKTLKDLKDKLLEILNTSSCATIRQVVDGLIDQYLIMGTSSLAAIPILLELKSDPDFQIKIKQACHILNESPCYLNWVKAQELIHKKDNEEMGYKTLELVLPLKVNAEKATVKLKKIEIEQLNNSNLYPLFAKCFPITLSKLFSNKMRIKRFGFNLIDYDKRKAISCEIYNQLGGNNIFFNFMNANEIKLNQNEKLKIKPKILCKFFRYPESFPSLLTDFEHILSYFKTVMDSKCNKRINIPYIINYLNNSGFFEAEKLDILVKTMITSLNYRAHAFFYLFASSLKVGLSENVLRFYEFLFEMCPDVTNKINTESHRKIILKNFTIDEICDEENLQKVLRKIDNNKKRKLEGGTEPSSKRKK